MSEATGLSRILTLVFADLMDSTSLKTQRGDQAVGELIGSRPLRAATRRTKGHEADGRALRGAARARVLSGDVPVGSCQKHLGVPPGIQDDALELDELQRVTSRAALGSARYFRFNCPSFSRMKARISPSMSRIFSHSSA